MGTSRRSWNRLALPVKADLRASLQMKIAGKTEAGVLLIRLYASTRRSTAK
jgi:hypothetical protein